LEVGRSVLALPIHGAASRRVGRADRLLPLIRVDP
jgi:hypothetical protein